jgi:uncharacterized repeat protein (TIGR03803 family)
VRRPQAALRPFLEGMETRTLLSGATVGIRSRGAAAIVEPVALVPRADAARQVVSSKPARAADTVLHNFGSAVVNDGTQPWGSLTLVRAGNSAVLFGETVYGGSSGRGAIFTISPKGKNYRIVHSFAGGAGDGSQPRYGQLQQVGNVLYGATLRGGPANDGVIFRINTDGTGYAVIHDFSGSIHDGSLPYSNPVAAGSLLIGMTSRGGANHQGAIYALNDDGTGFHILDSFTQATGMQPRGSVAIQGSSLYGMTRLGGTAGDGVVFRFDLNTNQYVVLHQFLGGAGDGATPDHGTLTVKGNRLYGLTTKGGRANDGVLFQMNTSGANFKILHAFAPGAKNGIQPQGSLQLQGSTLYGTASAGGRLNQGAVFRIGTSGRGFKVLHPFNGAPSDGAAALDNLLIYDGKLYGMTKFGGSVPTAKPRAGDPPFDNGAIFAMPLPR